MDGFISGKLRKSSSSNCFPLLLTMAQPGHLSDFNFLRSLRRCASPLAPEVKNILQFKWDSLTQISPKG